MRRLNSTWETSYWCKVLVAVFSRIYSIKGCLPNCCNSLWTLIGSPLPFWCLREKLFCFLQNPLQVERYEKATAPSTCKTRELPLQRLPAKVPYSPLPYAGTQNEANKTKIKTKQKEALLASFHEYITGWGREGRTTPFTKQRRRVMKEKLLCKRTECI